MKWIERIPVGLEYMAVVLILTGLSLGVGKALFDHAIHDASQPYIIVETITEPTEEEKRSYLRNIRLQTAQAERQARLDAEAMLRGVR